MTMMSLTGALARVAHCAGCIALLTAALVCVAESATAAHVVQSVALHSAGGSSAHATSFVRVEGTLYLAGSFSGEVDFNPNGSSEIVHAVNTLPSPRFRRGVCRSHHSIKTAAGRSKS